MGLDMKTYREFSTEQEARDFRAGPNGTGGWIFVPDDKSRAIIFPPDMSPSAIFYHPLVKGLSGNLIGHG